MKSLFKIFIFLLVCGIAKGQSPGGLPIIKTTSWYNMGFLKADSGIISMPRDTFSARYPSTMAYKQSDKHWYYWDSTSWNKILKNGDANIYTGNSGIKLTGTNFRWNGPLLENVNISASNTRSILFDSTTTFTIQNAPGGTNTVFLFDYSNPLIQMTSGSVFWRVRSDGLVGTAINSSLSVGTAGVSMSSTKIMTISTGDSLLLTGLATSADSTPKPLVIYSNGKVGKAPSWFGGSGGGGGGNTNSNIGSGYRWAVPGTNNIKTVFGAASAGILIDSSSNTNALTFKVDSSVFATKSFVLNLPIDTIRIIPVGASGLSTIYGNKTDTIFVKRLAAGSNITLTQNTDSSISIAATGSGVALDALQSYSSGTTVTVSNGNNILVINPSSTQSALTVTLPATPHNSNRLTITAGSTLTSGTVISSLTISPNSGQSIIQSSVPSTITVGEPIIYLWNAGLSTWFRLN